MLTGWLDTVAEADGYYLGGVVTPNETTLRNVLGIQEGLLDRHSAASGEMAAAMAAGCRERFKTDYALAVGRFPEFDPSAAEPKPVCVALADSHGVKIDRFPFPSDPALLKIFCGKRALNMVRLVMVNR